MTEYDPKPPERALPPSSSSGPTVRPPVPSKGTPTSRTKNKLAAEGARAGAESPAAREQAARLRALSAGTAENSIGKNLMRTLTYTPHVSALIDNFGPGLTANLLMGSTRALATRPRGAKDELSNYRRPVISAARARTG